MKGLGKKHRMDTIKARLHARRERERGKDGRIKTSGGRTGVVVGTVGGGCGVGGATHPCAARENRFSLHFAESSVTISLSLRFSFTNGARELFCGERHWGAEKLHIKNQKNSISGA